MAAGKPAARATVQIGGDDKKLRAVLRNLRKRLDGFFKSIRQAAARAGKLIAAGIAAGLAASIALAVKFEDVLTRTRGIFGEMASDAQDFARVLAGRLGKSVSEVLDTVNELGASFRAAGLSARATFELASRTAAAAGVLASRLGVDDQTVQDALMQASRGRATGLQRLGLGITPTELKELAESLQLDITDSADQIRLYARVLEMVESRIDTNTASIGQALDDGENASQRLSRIYAQIRDQLTELGQKMLPVFSNILAGISVMLGQIGEAFSTGGIGGVASMIINAAKPFTDILVGGLHDVFSWFLRAASAAFENAVESAWTRILRKVDLQTQGFTNRQLYAANIPEFETTRFDDAVIAAAAHLRGFGEQADAAAKEMREKFEAALAEIQAGAANLAQRIDDDLGPRMGRAVTEAAGTFSAAAAFSLEARMRNQEQRTRKAIEDNTDDLVKATQAQSVILRNIATYTRQTAIGGLSFS
jgi:hypothetical protein